jgi:hypothetical protein
MLSRAAHLAGTRRVLAVGSSLLLLALTSAAVAVLEQQGTSGRVPRPNIRASVDASQLRGAILSEVTSSITALGRAAREARTVSSAEGNALDRRAQRSRGSTVRVSRSGGGTGAASAAQVSHLSSTTRIVSPDATGGSSQAAATSVRDTNGPARVPTTRQAPQQEPVHYQPPLQPAGPAGLGSQVGGNCDPKCS